MNGSNGTVQRAMGRFSLYLAPSVIQVGISFVMLPIATRVVGPREYGIFALASAYTGFGTALATLGGSFIIAHRFLGATLDEQQEVVSTVTLLGLMAVALYGAVIYLIWPFLPGTPDVSYLLLTLSMAAVVIGQPWVVALDVLTIQGQARTFAAMSVVQSIVSAALLALGLFKFKIGVTSFFISQLGAALVSLVAAVYILRPFLGLRLNRGVMGELKALGVLSGLSNTAESMQVAVERSALSLHAGLSELGIYSNSQAYRGFASVPVKAVARSIWPITLRDARDPNSDFAETKQAWDIAYLFLTASGIFFATLGDWLIGTLTHGKFTAAYLVAMVWMMFLLLQNTGKPQVGVMYGLGAGRKYARLVILSVGVGVVALLLLTPWLGIWGAVVGAIVQQTFLRIAIQRVASSIRRTPFQDNWAFVGIAYIAAVFGVRYAVGGGHATNGLIFVIASVVLGIIARKPIVSAGRRILFGPQLLAVDTAR